MPKPGFHKAMRALTEEFGILLIFDEVKTGFRFAQGGAAEFFGITPDLATYAKAMGNGYPAAAFGGRAEVMSVLPDKVSHGGTYAGNRIAAAAAVKTLTILRDTDALEIDPRHRPTRSRTGSREILNPTGIPYHFTGHPSMFGIMFREVEATEYRDWADHRPRAVRRDRDRHACPRRHAGTGLARALVLLRGARPGRHRRSGRSRSFSDSLDAALEARAHGTTPPTPIGAHGSPGRRLNGHEGRWSSTATPSARSIARRPCCSRSARARARRA